LGDLNSDNPVKSLEIVMPDPVSGTGQARSGIQNALKLLDSGFRRNDGKGHFPTFYDTIKLDSKGEMFERLLFKLQKMGKSTSLK
jgi:hypothetical protein